MILRYTWIENLVKSLLNELAEEWHCYQWRLILMSAVFRVFQARFSKPIALENETE